MYVGTYVVLYTLKCSQFNAPLLLSAIGVERTGANNGREPSRNDDATPLFVLEILQPEDQGSNSRYLHKCLRIRRFMATV